jgi:PAS domain-containing protein
MLHIIISSIPEVPVIYYESAILISGTHIMEERIDPRKRSAGKIEDLHQKIDELEERLARFESIEEELRESEERYRSVINNVEVGIALISPTMEILALNNQMKK